jgi:hypothetical protein
MSINLIKVVIVGIPSPQLLIQIYYWAEVVKQTTNGGSKKNRV